MSTRLRVEAAYILVTLGGWKKSKAIGLLGISPNSFTKYAAEIEAARNAPEAPPKVKRKPLTRCRYCRAVPVEGVCNCIEPQEFSLST